MMSKYILKHIFLVGFMLALLVACMPSCKKNDGYREPESNDKTKPGPVSNVKVRNFKGGAVLTYALPADENLLYVVADYKINGKTARQTKSSFFLDTITVEGFQFSKDYTVTLHSVTR